MFNCVCHCVWHCVCHFMCVIVFFVIVFVLLCVFVIVSVIVCGYLGVSVYIVSEPKYCMAFPALILRRTNNLTCTLWSLALMNQ